MGGGGDPNIMMDGVSTMDTGSNRPLLQVNVESIAEVKVLTLSYQAEFGRASGVQVTAVTKSGTNRFGELAGCAQAQSGTGAIFCNNAAGSAGVPMTDAASLQATGLGSLPFLFPKATALPQGYYAVTALNELDPPF